MSGYDWSVWTIKDGDRYRPAATMREALIEGLREHACCFSDEEAEAAVDTLVEEVRAPVVKLLREMDAAQQKTDFDGSAELAWYYHRDHVEDALGVPRYSLDAARFSSAEQVMAYAEELAKEFGEDWPLTAPLEDELPINDWWASLHGWDPVRNEYGTLTGFMKRETAADGGDGW